MPYKHKISFQNIRENIFKDIVRTGYKEGKEKLKKTINDLPYKYAQNGREALAIKREIPTLMGLNTSNLDVELAQEVDTAFKPHSINTPLITVNQLVCDNCIEDNCKVNCIDNPEEGLLIDSGRCISCGRCIAQCPMEAISDKIEFLPLVNYLKKNKPIYAHVAPAITGQFGAEINMGQLRSALKSIGFTDMVEVALFADILTLREADEYNHIVKTKEDFLITSCCCPVWINLLINHYPDLNQRLTKTVSPMIASGRIIKEIFPEAVTVFIGPCIAKKAEAKAPELKGAIDYVLTFDELKQVFEALDVKLKEYPDDKKQQSSLAGRIYARSGGVSKAVELTVERVNPDRKLEFESVQASGIAECKKLLDQLKSGNIKENFIEGMGCEGGCVGGPKRIIEKEKGEKHVNNYAERSPVKNPIDNFNVRHILEFLSGLPRENKDKIDQLSFDKILIRDYK